VRILRLMKTEARVKLISLRSQPICMSVSLQRYLSMRRTISRTVRMLGASVAVVGTGCTQTWSTHLRTRFDRPAISSCAELTLAESGRVDTTVTLVDAFDGYFIATQPYPPTALPREPYSEVAFAGVGGHGRLVQTRDSEGLPDVTLSWTWSGQRPTFKEAQEMEQWLLAYLQRICRDCAGDSTLSAADVAIIRDWIPADSAR